MQEELREPLQCPQNTRPTVLPRAASCPPSPLGANQEKRVEIEAVTDLRNDGAFSSYLELRRYLTATAFIKTGVFSASTALRHC